MTPEQARGLKSELAAVTKQAQDLVSGLDSSALLKRPPSGGWSVAENLQHLILTAGAMLPLAEGALAELERRQSKSDRPAGLGFLGWLLVQSLEPPARMKTKTTKPFEPVTVDDPLALLARLEEAHAKLEGLIARAEGLATATIKVASPFNAKVTYNLYAALRIVLVHTRRHLWQAEQVKKAS